MAMASSEVVRYYSKLIETYIQLSLYEEAEATATRVLAVDPSNLIVRLKRGHARRRIGHLVGALADFETTLSISPKPNTSEPLLQDEALRQRDIVVESLGISYPELVLTHAKEMAQYNEPHLSTSQRCGSGSAPSEQILDEPLKVTCRFYNHTGCHRGRKCIFSHAPDAKSIRDTRGKNVCLYHLVGKCKWDMFTCIYSHSKDYLPREYSIDPSSSSSSSSSSLSPLSSPSVSTLSSSTPSTSSEAHMSSFSSTSSYTSSESALVTSLPSWWLSPARISAVRELISRRDEERKMVREEIEEARKRNDEALANGDKKRKKKKKKKSGNGAQNGNAIAEFGKEVIPGNDAGREGRNDNRNLKVNKVRGSSSASTSSHSNGDESLESLVIDWESESEDDEDEFVKEPEEESDSEDFEEYDERGVESPILAYGVKPLEHEETMSILVALTAEL